MDQLIGKLLDNRYELLELIGTGGMARVYKARCHRLNRLVAIKILREDLAQDAEFRRRFHDESQAIAMLSHPNIVAVYDVSRSSEMEYIVMELIDGITLKQYMQRKGNKLNWREALHFITQITKALGHAHSREIIHRDIKPQNIMVLRDGSVKVSDFGIARMASGGHSTLTQEALGSVHYISPEQARGSRIDARSDLYSAGVVLYEMITGRLPFEGDSPVAVAIQHINSIPLSPRELDSTIPEALEAITMKAMAPNPDNRYSCADEMLSDLEEFRKNPDINFDYSVSDFGTTAGEAGGQTQIIPVSTRGSFPDPERRRAPLKIVDYDDEGDRSGGGPAWPMVAAIVVILALIGVACVFVFRNVLSNLTAQPERYPVPNVTGLLLKEARQDKELLGEFVLVQGESREDDAEAGTILSQSPEAGTGVLEANTEITVTVSSGPKVVEMIPVANTEYLKALAELNNMGLKVATPTYKYSDDIPTGYIISCTPLPGTPMDPREDEVQLVVSQGPEAKTFVLPNFIGATRSWAESTLTVHNLKYNITEEYSSDYPSGQVIDQHPQVGEEVSEGSTVNLMISKGVDPESLPKEKTVEVTIPLPEPPDDGGTTLIQMTVTMEGETIFNETVDTAMQVSRTIPVTGTGKKELFVYFNASRVQTITVDFD